jgi:hypothetical protein
VSADDVAEGEDLTVAAIGVKPETRRHLSLRIGRVLAIPGAFLLPRRPIFRRLSVAPARAVARGRGGRAHGTTVPD